MQNIYYLCNMKLSIVIPVYQVADTLPRCLDSIANQSFRDWQGILVDDASTDGSSAICDDYVKQDRRFQVVHLKHNKGLSNARNVGLSKARGEYITFVDSDDFIADESFKTLFEILNTHPDYDFLEYPVNEHYGSKKKHLLQFQRKEYTDMIAYWIEGEAYKHAYAWNKIYKKEVFKGVKYPRKTFEDVFTLTAILKNCRRVATTDVGLYYYCYNPKGITETASGKDLDNLLEAHTRAISNIRRKLRRRRNKNQAEYDMKDYYAHVLNIQLDVYRERGTISKYFPILPYKHTFKLKLLHLFGLKRLCKLHKIFHRLR
jgi:glycosyltransferase involved in cell wall biosynthesis